MKRKVLVVDDDALTRGLLACVLGDFPVEVVEAAADDEAYQRFLEVGPDLILLDLLLPRQGGLALLRKIREVRGGREVPVLVMSAVYKEGDVRAEAVDRLGALDFLKKPFQMDVLTSKLSEVLIARPSTQAREVSVFPPLELHRRGELATLDFPVLLNCFGLHKTTGRLQLRREGVKKVLFLEEGKIVFALSNQIRETLGRYLFSEGLISEEDYRSGLHAMQREGRKMGEFLVESGAMTAPAVEDAIRKNVQDKVLDVFSWPAGDFQLTEYADPPAPLPGRFLDVSSLLWEGVRTHYLFERISAALSPLADLLLFPRPNAAATAQAVPVSEEQPELLQMLRRLEGQPLAKALSGVRGELEMRFVYFLLLTGRFVLKALDGGVRIDRATDLPNLERIRRARRRLESLTGKNCFQILAVPLDASDAKVRESYLRLAKEVHPDMLGPHDPPELQRLHVDAFQAVRNAYATLKSDLLRRQYLDFIQRGSAEEVSDGSRTLEAETCYMEGMSHLKKRAWAAAATVLRRAVKLMPEEGEYLCGLGIALMKQTAGNRAADLEEAEALLLRALPLLPDSPEPCLRLGQISAGSGDAERAAKFFQSALARKPDHVEALRELRLLRLRAVKQPSFFASILGKRESAR